MDSRTNDQAVTGRIRGSSPRRGGRGSPPASFSTGRATRAWRRLNGEQAGAKMLRVRRLPPAIRLAGLVLALFMLVWRPMSYRWGMSRGLPWDGGAFVGSNNGELTYWGSDCGAAPRWRFTTRRRSGRATAPRRGRPGPVEDVGAPA